MSVEGEPGTCTREEMHSQGAAWAEVLQRVQREEQSLVAGERFLFLGCGSQYYVGLCGAELFRRFRGAEAEALPAGEVAFGWSTVRGEPGIAVCSSRSGRTEEVLIGARLLRDRGWRVVCLGVDEGSPLAEIADDCLLFPNLSERSLATTRSTTGFVVALQAASFGSSHPELLRALADLPAAAGWAIEESERAANALIGERTPDFVFVLGSGLFYGVAREAALKISELSQTPAVALHSLEFHHGPKTLCGPGVLVIAFISGDGAEQQWNLLREVGEHGAQTLAVCEDAPAASGASAHQICQLRSGVPEPCRLPLAITVGQMVGFRLGLARGLDPDNPPHLSSFVSLSGSGEEPGSEESTPQ